MAARVNASEYRKNKYRDFFVFMDRDKDGFLTMEDFYENVQNLEQVGNLGEKHKISYQREIFGYWVLYAEKAKQNNGKIDKEYFVERNVVNHARPETVGELTRHYNSMFNYLDTDQNGKISLEELMFYYKAHDWTDESHVMQVFRKLDKDGDGFVTRDELVYAGVQFWCSDDPVNGYHWMYSQKQ